MTRRRVLLIAEAANPNQVSVPLVGWSLVRALADLHDTHLVTQVRNRAAIEATGWSAGDQFTPIDTEWLATRMNRLGNSLRGGKGKGWTTVMASRYLPYLHFERMVWKRFRSDLQNGRFDLVHRITPLSPTLPSPIAGRLRKLGVPFVIGPLNGGLPWLPEFDQARRRENEWLSYIRGAYQWMPGYRGTRKHASALLIGSRATWDEVPKRYRDKCVYIPENGIDPRRFSAEKTRPATRPIRCVFLGRLVPYKGPDMLLEAAAPLLKRGDVRLQFVGDGPLLEQLRRFIDDNDLPGVELLGRVDHDAVQQHLVESDVLTFPSIREFGGAVVLEAMALGLPALVVDYGGPGELVTDETGYRVPPGNREQIIERVRTLLSQLVADPRQIDHRGRLARTRVLDQFTWAAKAKQVSDVYDSLLDDTAARVDRTGDPSRNMPIDQADTPGDEATLPR